MTEGPDALAAGETVRERLPLRTGGSVVLTDDRLLVVGDHSGDGTDDSPAGGVADSSAGGVADSPAGGTGTSTANASADGADDASTGGTGDASTGETGDALVGEADDVTAVALDDVVEVTVEDFDWFLGVLSAALVGYGLYSVSRNAALGLAFAVFGAVSLYWSYRKRGKARIKVLNRPKPISVFPADTGTFTDALEPAMAEDSGGSVGDESG